MNEDEIRYVRVMNLIDESMKRMAAIHDTPEDFGTGVLLYRTEIHTIQAIGHNEGINLTDLAALMKVTKGAMSQMVTKLHKKGLILKQGTQGNAKEINLYLTELGQIGFKNHEECHMEMFNGVKKYYGDKLPESLKEFEKVFSEFIAILDVLGD
ncbi:MAG: MarR family transcriptional regulator [Acidobacteria bacterium]|nr:MarR family transcriptional regulator [Acidobacteriota bacterium]